MYWTKMHGCSAQTLRKLFRILHGKRLQLFSWFSVYVTEKKRRTALVKIDASGNSARSETPCLASEKHRNVLLSAGA
jgi:predicted 2-oxoglutarate/Fe(II)-dependent dioxygenase YbiX